MNCLNGYNINYPREITNLLLKFCYNDDWIHNSSQIMRVDCNVSETENLNSSAPKSLSIINSMILVTNHHIIRFILPQSMKELNIYASILFFYLCFVIFMHLFVFICLNIEFATWKYYDIKPGYNTADDN